MHLAYRLKAHCKAGGRFDAERLLDVESTTRLRMT